MRARGAGLKKDRHTVTASNPGGTAAEPEVSGGIKTWTYPDWVYHTFRKMLILLQDLKEESLLKPAFGEQVELHQSLGDPC